MTSTAGHFFGLMLVASMTGAAACASSPDGATTTTTSTADAGAASAQGRQLPQDFALLRAEGGQRSLAAVAVGPPGQPLGVLVLGKCQPGGWCVRARGCWRALRRAPAAACGPRPRRHSAAAGPPAAGHQGRR
jgi:hypothetical protein